MMTQWIKLSFRNILRNRRRSFVTIMAVGLGFAAISLYYGYIHYSYWALKVTVIHGEGLGHLRIHKASRENKGTLEQGEYMFSREETEKIIRLVTPEKGVILVTPQIQVTGMVSNEKTSAVFIAQGIIPGDDKIIQGQWADFLPVEGKRLDDNVLHGVEVSKDLAGYLKFTPGSDGVVMVSTLAGHINALDVRINGIYDTTNDFSNDKFMRFHFYFAQSLLDTQSAERLVVLLKDENETEKMRNILIKKIKSAGIHCEISAWDELSMSYAKIKSYLDTIFAFLFSIVLIIAVMTIFNTMGTAIAERTKEIGTLRALGLKRPGVSLLFALEGALLGFFGCLTGIVIHICVWAFIRVYPPSYIPPGFSIPVPIYVHMVPSMLCLLMLGLVFLSMSAAIIPAMRAARENIVDALGHN
jgi:putative ABC transport system permease protein